jgi:hypothetical protein
MSNRIQADTKYRVQRDEPRIYDTICVFESESIHQSIVDINEPKRGGKIDPCFNEWNVRSAALGDKDNIFQIPNDGVHKQVGEENTA